MDMKRIIFLPTHERQYFSHLPSVKDDFDRKKSYIRCFGGKRLEQSKLTIKPNRI